MTAPLYHPHTLRDTSEATGDILSACGVHWDASDIARFLSKTEDDGSCLLWTGAKSRGRGNLAWYGSFKPTFTRYTIRAHKFYAIAVLGLRPRPGVHHLDHTCTNSLCVRHVECVPESVNLKLRWIRTQVGLEDDADREELVRQRMAAWLQEKGRSFFHPDDADRLWRKYINTGKVEGLPENKFFPDIFDPRYW